MHTVLGLKQWLPPSDIKVPKAVAAADDTAANTINSSIQQEETPASTMSAEQRVCRFLNRKSYWICGVIVATVLVSGFITVTMQWFGLGNCLVPQGPTIKVDLQVAPFHKLKATFPGNVHIQTADVHKVTVESTQNAIDQITTTVQKGEWILGLKNRCFQNWQGRHRLDVCIETPDLLELTATGSGDIKADLKYSDLKILTATGSGDIKVDLGPSEDGTSLENKTITLTGSGDTNLVLNNIDVLTTKLTGSGMLTLTGDARTHTGNFLGSGDLHAFAFPTWNASLDLVGSGDVEVAVRQSLTVTTLGSGDVLYKGDPTVHKSGFGSGEVKRVGPLDELLL